MQHLERDICHICDRVTGKAVRVVVNVDNFTVCDYLQLIENECAGFERLKMPDNLGLWHIKMSVDK